MTAPPVPVDSARDQVRAQIVDAAAELLARGGREAVTTRAVAAAAGVQAPTLYRLFGDKVGLLDAVAEHGFRAYLARKPLLPSSVDPVDDLRRGWDLHVEFGLRHPALYALMYGDPRPDRPSPANAEAYRVLRAQVHRIAESGRLRLPERTAATVVHSCGSGTVLALLATPEPDRDLTVPTTVREAVLAAITTAPPVRPVAGPVAAAVALRAAVDDITVLTTGERGMLGEWLDRIATAPSPVARPEPMSPADR